MLPVGWYLLKVVICSGILLGYYWLFLRNKIFHSYNRFYLLAAIVLALSVPLIQINIWSKTAQPKSEVIQLLQVVTSGDDYVQQLRPSHYQYLDATTMMTIVYLIVSAIFLIGFIHVLWTIRLLVKKYQYRIVDNIWFINTDARGTPFSFLRYIFWNEKIDIESQAGNQIFRHEVAHVREKHSHDKIFLNIIMILFWCNPFFWLIRKELNMIHEFIADKKAVEDSDTAAFAAMILATAYPQHRFQLTNNFFYSPIKRRILMLTKNKNPKVNYLGRVLVLPLAVLVFAAFTFKAKVHIPIYNGKTITVVIDAGHGGADAGAISPDGSVNEKDINLAIVKKIKELNTNDKINIVLTREDDIYQSPLDKVTFSKQHNPDLFISFHVDNIDKGTANTKTGMSVWVPKDEFANAAKSRALASTIINTFSKDYGLSVIETLNQGSKVAVLQGNSCPAVLIEAGFINNEKDLAYLQTSAAKETIARDILLAIEKFAIWRDQVIDLPVIQVDTVPKYKILPDMHPIYFADGKEIDSIQAKAISPNDVQSINVLKGKAAIEKYGGKGTDGVVEIKMKKKDKVETGTRSSNDIKVEPDVILDVAAPKVNVDVLYILDGKETDKNVLQKISPDQIRDVNVLKNEEAIKQYGEKAKNGVVLITTKTAVDVKANVNVQADVNVKSTADSKVEISNVDYSPGEGKVFTATETQPSFPGGPEGWGDYLKKNLNLKIPVLEGWVPGTYTVMTQFIVRYDGSVTDITTTNYVGTKTAQHCIEIIKNSPKWKPAIQNGKAVNAYYRQPISFKITDQFSF